MINDYSSLMKNYVIMRTITSFIFLLVSLSIIGQRKTTISFNKNIEFLGYIIEIADRQDNDPNHQISKIIHQFPGNTQQKVFSELLQIAANIDYSTLIHLAYYLPEFPLESDYSFPEELSNAFGYMTNEEYNNMIQKLNDFYKFSQFEKIWNDLANEREKTITLINEMKPKDEFFDKMEWFYEKQFQHFNFSPSLTLWPAGFGLTDIEKSIANYIFGPIKDFQFRNKQSFITHAIHEFGHSFVNAVVLQNAKEILNSSYLFESIEKDIKPQGYSNWETCVIEHFVRAGEVIINEELGHLDESEAVLKEYVNERKWIYLPFIIDKLKHYKLENKMSYKSAVAETIKDLKTIEK